MNIFLNIKLIVRNWWRNKLFFLISLFSLTAGLGCTNLLMTFFIHEYNVDSLYEVASLTQKQKVLSSAVSRAENVANDLGFKKFTMENNDYSIRKHKTEWHKKITISLSCLQFFFIGTPMGCIIRK